MACPKAGAVVGVEVLVEQNVILPVRILLELLGSTIDGALAALIAEKNARQSLGNFFGNLEQGHVFPRAGGTLDLEVVPVEQVKVQQSADQEYVHRHPDRPAPVGIAP